MFNNSELNSMKWLYLLLSCVFFYNCAEEMSLQFSETSILNKTETLVEINIPKALGNTSVSNQINTRLEAFVNRALNIDAAKQTKSSISESIDQFNASYKEFKIQIGQTLLSELPQWEALVDGEVIYDNENIVSIAMNSSINTGAAHGNLIVTFLNFDVQSGKELKTSELILEEEEFTAIVKKYYDKELLTSYNETQRDGLSPSFKLPQTLGFNEEGLIIFYDKHNSPINDSMEFTIPYEVINPYLSF